MSSTPGWFDSTLHTNSIAIHEKCSFSGIKTPYLRVYCPTHDFHHSIRNYEAHKTLKKRKKGKKKRKQGKEKNLLPREKLINRTRLRDDPKLELSDRKSKITMIN